MTLTFLGQPYQTTTTELPATTTELTGLYRGTPVRFSHAHRVATANIALTYRGVSYTR